MFVERGFDATELGQCPYAPGTEEWKTWQHDFMSGQSRDPDRYDAAVVRGQDRMAAVKEQVLATRTEANDWHDSVMTEIEEPKPQRVLHGLRQFISTRWADDDLYNAIIRPQHTPNFTTQVSGSGYTAGGALWSIGSYSITGTFTVTDPSMWQAIFGDPWDSGARWCTGDPIASPREHRRTRGQTIEERRLCQALSGKPITVRRSPQNHAWKRK